MRGLWFFVAWLTSTAAFADPKLVSDLAWLPAETVTVVGGPPASSPMSAFVSQLVHQSERPPRCFDYLFQQFDLVLQLWNGAFVESSPVVARGRVEREMFERCAEGVITIFGFKPTLQHDGALTQISSDKTKAAYVGFAPGWVVWHEDRARVLAILAALGKRNSHPNLDTLLKQVDPTAPVWAASVKDYTSPFLGIESLGLYGTVDTKGKRAPTTIVFAKARDANRAAARIVERAHDAFVEPALRAALTSAGAKARGLTITLDVAPFMKPEAMSALEAWVKRQAD
jgi:hypothetical protein